MAAAALREEQAQLDPNADDVQDTPEVHERPSPPPFKANAAQPRASAAVKPNTQQPRVLSKAKYHQKTRFMARRLRLRSQDGAKEAVERQVKAVAIKRRRAAEPLEMSFVLLGQSPPQQAKKHKMPLQEVPGAGIDRVLLTKDKLQVTEHAFVAKRRQMQAGDKDQLTKSEALSMGMEYVPWNGR